MSDSANPLDPAPGNFDLHRHRNPRFAYAPDGRPMHPAPLPVDKSHPVYPVMIGLALFPIAMGPVGHDIDEDVDPKDTHPFFPDHFWPYPIIMAVVILVVAAAAALLIGSFNLDQPADPRVTPVGGPRPEWYFMFLFQFLKMGPELIQAIALPGVVTGIMVLWPWLDKAIDAMQTHRWQPPARNPITGLVGVIWLMWMIGLGVLGLAEADPNLTWAILLGATLILIGIVALSQRGRGHRSALPLGQTATFNPAPVSSRD